MPTNDLTWDGNKAGRRRNGNRASSGDKGKPQGARKTANKAKRDCVRGIKMGNRESRGGERRNKTTTTNGGGKSEGGAFKNTGDAEKECVFYLFKQERDDKEKCNVFLFIEPEGFWVNSDSMIPYDEASQQGLKSPK